MGYCLLSMRLGAGLGAGQAGVQGAGRWAQARVAGVRTGAQGVLALGVGAGARTAGERQRRWGTQALGRAGERHGMGARSAGGLAGARLGERARGWAHGASGWAHGARGARPAGSTGAQPVRTGWASWVLVHPAWFSAWFFDSVFFLSH